MGLVSESAVRVAIPAPTERQADDYPGELGHHMDACFHPDWEQLIAVGTVPALVLGAERRLRRS